MNIRRLFYKPRIVDIANIEQITFNNTIYPLDYSGDSDKELEKLFQIFELYIQEEISIYNLSKDNTRPEDLLFHQLSILNPRRIASIPITTSVVRAMTDNDKSKSAARFLDAIQYAYMVVNREYMLSLKGRFLFTVLTPIVDNIDNLILSESNWIDTFDLLPWVHLLPVFNLVVATSGDVARHKVNVGMERSRLTHNVPYT